MENRRREYWWLLALEATLFFSLPCWESTAPWAEPVTNPLRFAVALFAGATVAMLACHLGPAVLSARFGSHRYRFSSVLLLWLSAGYLERILVGAWTVALWTMPTAVPGESRPSGPLDWLWLGISVAFLATVIVAASVGSWWKPVAAGVCLLGIGIVVWALATTWHGLWVRNPNYAEQPVQFELPIVKGMLLSAAPAVVIGWRIGRIEPEPKRIWLSGLSGVWLPLVVSVTVGSLADQAGANLYWVPSLFRGFNWALLGARGQSLTVAMTLAVSTMLGPALLSAVCLKELAPLWTGRQKMWLVPMGACLLIAAATSIAWHYGGLYSTFATPAQQLWAWSLVVLGAAAGLSGGVGTMARWAKTPYS